MNSVSAPKPKPQATAPDPDSEAAKKKSAEERNKLNMKRGSSRTIATSPVGVLGAAPVNKPELKGSLG